MLLTLSLLLGAAGAADWPDLSRPPKGAGDGSKDVALVIGIEDYAFAPDVPGATRNARDWYAWLQDTRGVGTIKVLLDADATREGMLDAARAVAARAREGGTTWVVFIGHGAPAASADDGLLVGVDAQQKAASLEARSVRRGELLDLLQGPQAQTVVVLDACFSGQTAAGSLVPGLQPLKPVAARTGSTATALTTTVLTAAASDQYAGALPGQDRPAFSYLVLGALWGWGDTDGSGTVTADEAVRYASDALFRTVNDRSQTPSLEAPEPALVLGRGRASGAPDLGAIALGSKPAPTPTPSNSPQSTPDQTEATLRQQATAAWQAIVTDPTITDPSQAMARVSQFLATYENATVTVNGQTRPVDLPEVAQARQALLDLEASEGGVDTGSYGYVLPPTCRAQGQAVLMEIALLVNAGTPPAMVAQGMVSAGTCYTSADIQWLQLNGAPWEVVQQAQGLWVGW